MTNSVHINVRELLQFYDADKTVKPHSNAIKTLAGEELGFALLLKYFEAQGLQPKLLDDRCTTKGAWLDGWVSVQDGGKLIQYQVEVKSWSLHGYTGGKALEVNCSPDKIHDFKKSEWARYWNSKSERFHALSLDKVLKKMRPTNTGVLRTEVRPLACLWAAVHPDGLDIPFFDVKVKDDHFSKVWVFSMSAFLRNYLQSGAPDFMTLEMPKTTMRLAHLSRIFS